MKKILLALLFTATVLVSFIRCHKSDDPATYTVRDYAEQYAADKITIDTYIDTHKMTVDTDGNVTFSNLASGELSIRQQTTYPLQEATVTYQNVEHKYYYIKLDEGTQNRPTTVDSVFVSYKAYGIETITDTSVTPNTTSYTATAIDSSPNPVWFKLQDLVPGWGYGMPYIKSGNVSSSGVNNIYSGYGNIVFFFPSALGYYNGSAGFLPQYTPLIFTIKLYSVFYRDHDGDKVKSKDEIIKTTIPDPIINLTTLANPMDTDGDGVIDMYDVDDDGDHYLTKYEIRSSTTLNANGKYTYFKFDNSYTDDVYTDYDETLPNNQIPSCSGDYTSSTRLRKHLDATCH